MIAAEPSRKALRTWPLWIAVPASSLALATYPVAALLLRIWRRPGPYFGFLAVVTVTVLRETASGAALIPPELLVCLCFLVLAVLQGGLRRMVRAWLRNQAPLWLYVFVCAVDVFLVLYQRDAAGWPYVAGHVAFLMVILTTVGLCETELTASDVLAGMAWGVGLFGLLTVIHAYQIVDLPFAARIGGVRTFGSIRMPVGRTMGLDMSPGKVGIFGAIGLSLVIASFGRKEPLLRRAWARVLLLPLAGAAVLIGQSRTAYLTMMAAIGFSAFFALSRSRQRPWFGRTRGAWCLTVAYSVFLALGAALLPVLAPVSMLSAGSQHTVQNVMLRYTSNVIGWELFRNSPLVGVGLGSFENVSFAPGGIHNHFWAQFVATGLLGGIPYLLFHMLILVQALSLAGRGAGKRRSIACAVSAAMMATYLAFQSFAGYFTSSLAILCGLVLSLSAQGGASGVAPAPALTPPANANPAAGIPLAPARPGPR